jgi:hypothetical protein
VLDRDEKRDEEVAKLEQALGSRCKIRILPVREIENYLVNPEPLARYISTRLAKGDGSGPHKKLPLRTLQRQSTSVPNSYVTSRLGRSF